MFPRELLRLFVRDRKTLAVFRRVCRDLADLTVNGTRDISVTTYDRSDFVIERHTLTKYTGATPYALSPLWCPFSAYTSRSTVFSGDYGVFFSVATIFHAEWKRFARHIAREFLLVGKDPLIPYITIDGAEADILVEYVALGADPIDPDELHYAVVVEPPWWAENSLPADKFGPSMREDGKTIVVTLLAHASAIYNFCAAAKMNWW